MPVPFGVADFALPDWSFCRSLRVIRARPRAGLYELDVAVFCDSNQHEPARAASLAAVTGLRAARVCVGQITI